MLPLDILLTILLKIVTQLICKQKKILIRIIQRMIKVIVKSKGLIVYHVFEHQESSCGSMPKCYVSERQLMHQVFAFLLNEHFVGVYN